MLELQHHWIIVLFLSLFIATYLLNLYRKEHDKRKLTFSIALYLSSITYIGLLLGFINLNFGENISPLSYNVFSLTSFPLLYAIILAAHEPLIKIKNYDKVFYPFLIVSVGTLSLVFLPFKLTILSYFYLIVSLEVVPVILYFSYKYRSLENLYFFFFLCCSAIGGIGRTYDYGFLSAFSFFVGYVFIGLLFVKDTTEKSGTGVSHYFSMEQKLRSVEKRYEQLFNSIPESISLFSTDGRLMDANTSMVQSLGLPKNEIIGQNIQCFLPEKLYNARIVTAKKAIRTGQIQKNEDQNDGVYFSNTFIPLKDENNQNYLLLLSKNISDTVAMKEEREEKIRELRKTEIATLSIMEDMQETNQKLELAKKEIEDKNEELRNNMEELQALNQELNVTREQLVDLNENLEEKVEERTRELEEKTTNLEQVNMELIKTEEEREKIIVELSEKRDENQRLLKQKDSFINQLGHDLRTPLTPMLGLLPLLKKRITDEKGLKYISMIDRNIRFMKDLVNKTITFAKLNSDKIEFSFTQIKLFELINNVQQLLHATLQKEEAQLDFDIDPSVVVYADEMQISEVFHNLISNALKYSKKHTKPHIKISAEQTNDDEITIKVDDNGIGMTTDQIDHIFDEFYKADVARTDVDSHGLGLNICQRIINKHGGKIWVTSEGPDKGSQFIFTLHITNGKWNPQFNQKNHNEENIIYNMS